MTEKTILHCVAEVTPEYTGKKAKPGDRVDVERVYSGRYGDQAYCRPDSTKPEQQGFSLSVNRLKRIKKLPAATVKLIEARQQQEVEETMLVTFKVIREVGKALLIRPEGMIAPFTVPKTTVNVKQYVDEEQAVVIAAVNTWVLKRHMDELNLDKWAKAQTKIERQLAA